MFIITQVRTYGLPWHQLKRDKRVRLTANRLLHPRIIKALQKEKWLDLGYKIEISPKIAIMTFRSEGSILTFELEERVPISELWRFV